MAGVRCVPEDWCGVWDGRERDRGGMAGRALDRGGVEENRGGEGVWEIVLGRVRGGAMTAAGMPRRGEDSYDSFAN